MAILEKRNIKINPLDLPQNDKVAVGVTLPFDGPAVFNSSFTTKEQVKSNLINLLLTTPGERLMNPTFGVGIRNLLFEQVIDKQIIKNRIIDGAQVNIPEIEVTDVFIKRENFATKGIPGRGANYFTDRITDPTRLKFLDEAAKKYGYKDYKSVPITKAKKRGGTRYGDREKVIQEANRRQKGTLTRSEVKKGKIPENIRTGALYDAKIKQKQKDTLKKKTLATPRGERLQWIADNGKKYDNPKDFIKAYEKHFNHKLGSKSDALFSKKLLEKDGRVPLTTIDNLQNTGKAADIFYMKPGFSEEEIFKASIIQNNPRVQKKFRNLFSEIHNNVSLYSELGPEGIVERLNSGKLLEDFDFINATSSGGTQTYGGVHQGITRSSLKAIGVPDEHIVSYQTV